MPSRVEKHEGKENTVSKRTLKNQGLYQDLKDYSSLQEVTEIEAVIENPMFQFDKKLEKQKSAPREEVLPTEKLSSVFLMKEDKEYDINKVLKNAKSSRDVDELEEKRKLKKEEYNIVKEIGLDKIDSYKESKEKREKEVLKEAEKEELEELIDTIYSKTLADEVNNKDVDDGEKDKDLLSDLLPTDAENTIINEELTKMLIKEEREEKAKEKLDDSFFTKSNDLTASDLLNNDDVVDDEEEDFFEDDTSMPKWIWIPICLSVIIVVSVIIYLCTQGL